MPSYLALEPPDWDAVVELRRRGSGGLTPLHAHAAATDADESLCGLRVVVAEPRTLWTGWLEDEWGPIVRCPTCDAAAR